MPSAFTPNGDEVNDEFQFATECRLEYFHFEIYDRWGKKVFEGADENAVWKPSANTPEGLYAVKYYYKGKDNANIVEFTKYQSILIIK